jgi:hypothetical protein
MQNVDAEAVRRMEGETGRGGGGTRGGWKGVAGWWGGGGRHSVHGHVTHA